MTRFVAALLAFAAFACVFGFAVPAFAGSYLERAALLLDETRKEGDLLKTRLHDKELIAVVQALAETRAKVAKKAEVPEAIAKAHPHFLLVLENAEQAVEAAAQGNFKKFVEHLNTARDEDRTFRALVKELGYTLPELTGKK